MDSDLERRLRATIDQMAERIDQMAERMLYMQAAVLCSTMDMVELAEAFKPSSERADVEIAEAAIARARMRGIA